MRTSVSVTERSRRLSEVFPLEDAAAHAGASLTRQPRLNFTTPAAAWAYAVSLPARWPADAGWVHSHEGVIRVRLEDVQGSVSLVALDSAGAVIDEIRVDGTGASVEADLVSAPLGICHTVVLRKAPPEGKPSHGTIDRVECIDVGRSRGGDRLTAPSDRRLRRVKDWPLYYSGQGRTLAERIRRVRYGRLDRPKPMPWLEQLEVVVYPNDDLSRALYISGLYEPLTMLVLRRMLRAGACFIDVGANVGLYSMVASRWVGPGGQVHAFEPSEREFSRLLAHLALNGSENVKAWRQAVGSHDRTADLRVASYPNAGHNTLGASFAYPGVETDRVETVETVTLDGFVRVQQITNVDAIKIDVEGSEHAALAGAAAVLDRFRPAVIVEISRSALARCDSNPEQVFDLLTASRYAVYRIDATARLVRLPAGETVPDGDVVALPVGVRIPFA